MGTNALVNVHMDLMKVLHKQAKTLQLVVSMHAKPFHGIHVTARTPMHVWERIAYIQIHTFILQYKVEFSRISLINSSEQNSKRNLFLV